MLRNFILTGAIIVIILLIGYIFYYKKFKTDKFVERLTNYYFSVPINNNPKSIPKVIWTYWHDLDKVPHIVSKCIDTWLYNNEDYQINLINNERFEKMTNINVDDVFSVTNNKSHQKISDFIRLNLIYLYGGIWIDASMICSMPLNWVHILQKNKEYVGYISPGSENDPIVDSWFMAAIPKSVFIYDWLQEFTKSLQYNDDNIYCDKILTKYPVPKNIINYLPYLTVLLSSWVILHNNPSKYKLYLMSSTLENGPLHYIQKYEWSTKKMLKSFVNNPTLIPIPLFKITGPMRKQILKTNYVYNTNNVFINYVLNNRY